MRVVSLLLLLAAPLLEVGVLIKVGQLIGFWWTVALIAGTGLAGLAVIVDNGLSAPFKVQEAMLRGEAPLAPMLDGALVVVAGVLLLTPGLIADLVGLALLVPPLRRPMARWVVRRLLGIAVVEAEAGTGRADGRWSSPARGEAGCEAAEGPVIEGEFERLEERTIDPRRRHNGPDQR